MSNNYPNLPIRCCHTDTDTECPCIAAYEDELALEPDEHEMSVRESTYLRSFERP